MTTAAMHGGPDAFQPFEGPYGQSLRASWQPLYAAGREADLWPDEANETADAECIKTVLPRVQSTFSQFTAENRYDDLMSSFNTGALEGAQHAARLRSCKSRAASIWLDTLPVAPSLRLKNADVVSNVRHRLGLSQMPARAHAFKCHCGRDVPPDDIHHAMSCNAAKKAVQMRHDMYTDAWCLTFRRGGVATSKEPRLDRLRTGPARNPGAPNESRGDILLVLPEDSLSVADISVTHPPAPSFVAAAALRGGAAAARRDQDKRNKYRRIDSTGYTFHPLTVETYGRLGTPAMQLLNKIADIAENTGSVHKGAFVTNALRQLSIALCRGNALVYRHCAFAMNRLTGVAPTSGLLAPTSEIF